MVPRPLLSATVVTGGRLRAWATPPATLTRTSEVRWAIPRIVLVFLVARLIVVACAIGVETLAAPDPAGPAGSIRLVTDRPILGSLTSWDGIYYLGIAADGYQAGPVNGPYPEVVFFPLYPVLIRVVATLVGGDLPLAAVAVANVAALAALLLVYQLARLRLSSDASLLAVTLVALQPGAVAFSMAYSDSLFLLLTVGSLLCAERGARPASGILGLLAALTRPQGVLLAVPLLMLSMRQDGRRPRPSWAWAAAPLLGIGAFALFMWHLTGDPLAPLTAQSAWDFGRVPDSPPEPWVLALAAVIYGGTALVAAQVLIDQARSATRRDDRAGLAWALLNIAAIGAARRLQSLPRYLAPITLLAEGLASGRSRARVVAGVLAASVAAYTVLAMLHFSLRLAP